MPRLHKLLLLFLIFDIVIALFVPIAAAFQSYKLPALVALFFFLAILMVPYAYLWRFAYLGRPHKKKGT
jgi:NADH:ubiquinone oxidoreductase subunit 3 (subunit A)